MEVHVMKSKRFIGLILILALVIQTAGCGGGPGAVGNGDTNWKYEKVIKEPLKASVTTSEATIGDVVSAGVQVKVAANAFDANKEITITNPDKVPKVVGKEFTPVGTPVEISAGEPGVRMDAPVTVTIKLDPALYGESSSQPGDFFATYFNGNEWEYIRPTSVDLEAGTLSFETYHFSLFGAGKVSVDEQVSKYVKSKAVGEWAQENVDERVEAVTGALIDHILKEKLGIDDESTKSKVLGNLLKNDEWADIVKKARDGDVLGVNESVQLLVGKSIIDFVPKSKLKSALEGVTSNLGVETAKKAAEAAGYIAEGNYRDAAEILGTHIADQFMFTQVARVAVAAVQYKIDSWKSEELEAAYKVYKNGASSSVPFWGYQVEQGNFDDVWSQMKGAARQVEIDAVKAQEAIRKEAGMPPLNAQEILKIKEAARDALKDAFERRIKEDAEIAKKEEELKNLIDQYKSAKLLTPGEWGYPETYYSVENRLDELTHFRDKVLRDTGRKGLTNGAFSTKEKVNYADLVQLTQAWYTKPDGQMLYAKLIKEKFNIDLFPKVEEVNGKWNGSFTMMEIKFPPEEKKPDAQDSTAAAADPNDPFAGCDLDIPIAEILKELEKMKGKEMPVQYVITLDKTGKGTMELINDGDSTPMQATYNFGKLTATIKDEEMTATFTAFVSKNDKGYEFMGNWEMPFKVKDAKEWYGIKGTFKATKPLPPKPKAPAVPAKK